MNVDKFISATTAGRDAQIRRERNTQAIAARLLQRAAENALELGNFPLGPTDVQCVYECWVADTGRHLARAATMGDVRDHLSALGFPF